MNVHDRIDNLLKVFTENERELFERNIDLWEKTAKLNGRPQHLDSFDVDLAMVNHEWYYLLEDINSIEYDSTTPPTVPADSCATSDKIITRSSISPKLRFEILERDGFRCQTCGATAQHRSRLEIDHKIPKKHGGTDESDNLWTLCFSCNRGKGSKII